MQNIIQKKNIKENIQFVWIFFFKIFYFMHKMALNGCQAIPQNQDYLPTPSRHHHTYQPHNTLTTSSLPPDTTYPPLPPNQYPSPIPSHYQTPSTSKSGLNGRILSNFFFLILALQALAWCYLELFKKAGAFSKLHNFACDIITAKRLMQQKLFFVHVSLLDNHMLPPH